eukprot:6791634-Ditylum_brightwellii.AAC.1
MAITVRVWEKLGQKLHNNQPYLNNSVVQRHSVCWGRGLDGSIIRGIGQQTKVSHMVYQHGDVTEMGGGGMPMCNCTWGKVLKKILRISSLGPEVVL